MDRTTVVLISLFLIFALFVLAGFYLVFDKIGTVQLGMKDLELSIASLKRAVPEERPAAPEPIAPVPAPATSTPTSTVAESAPTVSTAIIFQASSSASLQPQTKLTVQVEKVTRETDGTITLSIKVFTGEASGYSAFDPRAVLELIDLEEGNREASLVTGSFNSMPAKSAISGSVVFKTDSAKRTIFLQVGSGEELKFYEFDFERKTYRETVIG